MGRPKMFNPENAIRKAMYVFWQNGYDVSMEILLKSMGISRSSFYQTWADKYELYIATMNEFHIISEFGFKNFTLFSVKQPTLDIIVLQFALSYHLQVKNEQFQSCYISNCVLQMGMSHKEVQNTANRFFNMYKDGFKHVIENAIKLGELNKDFNSIDTAWYLVNAISGLGVMYKSGVSDTMIENIIIRTLSIFPEFNKSMYENAVKDVINVYGPKFAEMMS